MNFYKQIQRSLSPNGRLLSPLFIWLVMIPTVLAFFPVFAFSLALTRLFCFEKNEQAGLKRLKQQQISLEQEFLKELQQRRLSGKAPL